MFLFVRLALRPGTSLTLHFPNSLKADTLPDCAGSLISLSLSYLSASPLRQVYDKNTHGYYALFVSVCTVLGSGHLVFTVHVFCCVIDILLYRFYMLLRFRCLQLL